MRRWIGVLGCWLALCAICPANAQTRDAVTYKSLAQTLSRVTSDYLILASPGQFVDPAYDANDVVENYGLAAKINGMLQPALLAKPASLDVSRLYSDVLNRSIWATVPLLTAQRDELERVRTLLFGTSDSTPTPTYQTYLDLKKAFDEIEKVYEATPPDQVTPELQQSRDNAEQDLNLRGHRLQFEQAEQKYASLKEQASYSWREGDRQRLASATLLQGDGTPTVAIELSPALNDEMALSWTAVDLDMGAASKNAGSLPFESSLQDSGLTWWAISSGVLNGTCSLHLDKAFHIHFELASIQIGRNWLDTNVFSSQAWRWSDARQIISDGTEDGNRGSAPLYVRSALIARNIVLSGPAIQECSDALRHAIRNRAVVSFGPFIISGQALGPDALYLAPILSRNTLRVPYLEIIAYGAGLLPKTPNPNSDFLWP